MLRPYQRRLLFSYLANSARRLDRRDPAAADLASWVDDNAPVLDDDRNRERSCPSAPADGGRGWPIPGDLPPY